MSEERWPASVEFRLPAGQGSAWPSSFLPLEERHTSEIVPAGRYVLEARMPGGRVASAPVVLEDGKTAVVELDL